MIRARPPRCLRRERDIEEDTPIREARLGRRIVQTVEEAAVEVAVVIGVQQRGAAVVPMRADDAAIDEFVPAHIENVGEVGADDDLELKVHRREAVVRDRDLLADAVADLPLDDHAEGAGGERAGLGLDGGVRVVPARLGIGNRAAVDQRPRRAIDAEFVMAEEARVLREEPKFSTRLNVPSSRVTMKVLLWLIVTTDGPTRTSMPICASLLCRTSYRNTIETHVQEIYRPRRRPRPILVRGSALFLHKDNLSLVRAMERFFGVCMGNRLWQHSCIRSNNDLSHLRLRGAQ